MSEPSERETMESQQQKLENKKNKNKNKRQRIQNITRAEQIQQKKIIKESKKQHQRAKAQQQQHREQPEQPEPFLRQMVPLPLNLESKDDHQENITIMTYNILAQSLCRRELYPKSGDALKWKNRRPQLIKEILHYHPDVACFQEMDYDNYTITFKPEFEQAGYETFFYKSIGNDKKKHGCCIIWQTSKFTKLKHLTLEFDQIGVPTMPTNCIGVIVSLEFNQNFSNDDKPNLSKSGIVIGTTHLYWRPQCMYERARQCLLLYENLMKINEEFEFAAFLVGDFNSSPLDPAYKLMIGKDSLNKEEINILKDSMKHFIDDDEESKSKESKDESSSSSSTSSTSSGVIEKNESIAIDQKSDRTLLDTTDNLLSSSMTPSLTTASIESSKTGDLIKPPLDTLISPPSPTLPDLLVKFSEFPQCISLYSKYYSLIDPENVNHNEPKFTNCGKFFSGALDYIFHVNKSSHRHNVYQTGETLKITEEEEEQEREEPKEQEEQVQETPEEPEEPEEEEEEEGKKESQKECKYIEEKLLNDNITEKINKLDNLDNEIKEIRVLSLLRMPSEKELNEFGLFLPNDKFSSDHFCLMVEIENIT
ncbi:hypothetical protein Glove_220g28 [Diversispora epigaea]|uniref:Endonuclease/exonuclease/phosphatase domain-containing protein n=1 Tax=Diversispora epigaea TaxID=1348612 RepID=A0A397IPI0_9GLOM|nr:hypothetical protein Glove_220g28 [Diversispora epigaea]